MGEGERRTPDPSRRPRPATRGRAPAKKSPARTAPLRDPVEELGRRIRVSTRRMVRQSIFARGAAVAYDWVSPDRLVVIPRTLGRISRRVRSGHVRRKQWTVGLWESVKESRAFSVGRLWAPVWYVLRGTVARPMAAAILAATAAWAALGRSLGVWGTAAWSSVPSPAGLLSAPARAWQSMLDAADRAYAGERVERNDDPLPAWGDSDDNPPMGDERRRALWIAAAITGVAGVILMFLLQLKHNKPPVRAAVDSFAQLEPTPPPKLPPRRPTPPPAATIAQAGTDFDPFAQAAADPPREPARAAVDWEDPIWKRLGIRPPSENHPPQREPDPVPDPLPEPEPRLPPALEAGFDVVRRDRNPHRVAPNEEFLVRSSPRDRAEPVAGFAEILDDWGRFAMVRSGDPRRRPLAYADRLHPLDRERMLDDLKRSIDPEGNVSSRSDLRLRITKRAPARSQPGEPLAYQLVVRNDGDEALERVLVEDVVPASHEVLNVAPLALLQDRTLRWQLNRLRPGEEQTLHVELQPVAEGPLETTSTVRAYAAVAFQTEVAGPRLKLEVVSPDRVNVGEPFPIRYRITNVGAAPATEVTLREDLPAELSHRDGRRLDCDLGTLEPGESRDALLTATGAAPGTAAHQAAVEAAGGTRDAVTRPLEVIERPPEPPPQPTQRPAAAGRRPERPAPVRPPREPRPPIRFPARWIECLPAPCCCP